MYYFLSDIHLRDDEEENTLKLSGFLDTLNLDNCKKLFLLGDIFDLWVADHKVFKIKFKNLLESFKRLSKEGVEVHYFEGNHDLYLEKFWQKEMGFFTHKTAKYFELEGLKFRLEHGDEANPKDLSYLRYRRFLRTPFMNFLAYRIPGAWIDNLGLKASKKSRQSDHRYPWNVKEVLRNHIQNLIDQGESFDVLITGHMHERIEEDFMVGSKTIKNINLGWWGEEAKILKLEDGHFSWIKP